MDPTTIAKDSLKPSRRSKWTWVIFHHPSTDPNDNRRTPIATHGMPVIALKGVRRFRGSHVGSESFWTVAPDQCLI
jgi:hypothetical protein